jgi:hypothetical protein
MLSKPLNLTVIKINLTVNYFWVFVGGGWGWIIFGGWLEASTMHNYIDERNINIKLFGSKEYFYKL